MPRDDWGRYWRWLETERIACPADRPEFDRLLGGYHLAFAIDARLVTAAVALAIGLLRPQPALAVAEAPVEPELAGAELEAA